jgi:hypothetical protein
MGLQHQDDRDDGTIFDLELRCDERCLASLLGLFQIGAQFRVKTGLSVRALLCGELGIDSQYLDGRVGTLFLDGKPVDDVDHSLVRDGSVLSLSAALPGFAGAALRKGGFYAGMRRGITHAEEEITGAGGLGTVTLKLYNMVAQELGPRFLKEGVLVPAQAIKDFFTARSESFFSRCGSAVLNGDEIKPASLASIQWPESTELVLLRAAVS